MYSLYKLGINWDILEGFPNWEGSVYRTQFIEIDSPGTVVY